ncbi:MAG: AAA family ATPase [Mycobacteriales bacterium]
MTYVVVSGSPGSGKTTLAGELAPALGLPLLAKDTIKRGFEQVLDVPDVPTSRHVGRASVTALLAVAAANPAGAVLESAWHRSRASGELAALPGPVVEVFCRCPREVSLGRYRDRQTRHDRHLDALRVDDELWNDEVAEPVAGGWPVLEVDTRQPVDVPALVDLLDEHLR